MSFTSNFFAYFKFRSDWGRVTGKIKQNDLDFRDTPLSAILSSVEQGPVYVFTYPDIF